MTKQYGPYHILYENNQCLWQNHVGVMVARFVQLYARPWDGTVLDLGGGEGDNAVFLAEQDWSVRFVELSPLAIAHLQTKLKSKPRKIASKIQITQGNSLELKLGVFDLVIAYGLLHCFATEQNFKLMCNRIVEQVKPGGHIIISALTDVQVSASAHPELIKNFIPSTSDLHHGFADMTLVEQEVENIVERHGEGPEHQHDIFRAIYLSV